MHIPVTYRCRAECELDARRLLEQIPIGHLVSMDIVGLSLQPDVLVSIKVTDLSLKTMRQLCRKVPDGHVMRETIMPIDHYTGQRQPVSA